MKQIFLFLLTIAFSISVFGQDPPPTATPESNESTNVTGGPAYQNLPLHSRSDLKLIPNPSLATQSTAYTRPDAATRRKRFVNSTVGPFALGRMALSAGYSTWRNSPEEWGTKWEGFGRRFASSFGRNAIKQTTKFGLDEALKYDSHFYRSGKTFSTGTRLKRALLSPLVAKNKSGRNVVGVPNLVGTYASSVIAYETWYPKRYDWKDGLRSGTISLGFTAAFNVFKEFVNIKK